MMSYHRDFPYKSSVIAIVEDHKCEVFFIINLTLKWHKRHFSQRTRNF